MFDSLDRILGSMAATRFVRQQQAYTQLLKTWAEVVGSPAARYSRPLSCDRGILKVATASAVWAQTLTLKRHQIVGQLRDRGYPELKDIRCSTRDWSQTAIATQEVAELQQLWQQHPSRLPDEPPTPAQASPEAPTDAKTAFQSWAAQTQAKSACFPLCPQCQAPTPPGELERWSVCALCAARRWSGR
ncbi:MAG: DUF721 domain-containing protein [Cyanobacteria bacterium J007]|nr:MAG: DUF721 domain-containing protein [Cyanobacteria bacterium J007]